MNKLFLTLILSVLLSSSVAFGETKPTDTCNVVANFYYKLAVERDKGVSPVELAHRIWYQIEEGSLSKEQVAHLLLWTIEVYSSPESPTDLKVNSYKACMKATGKTQV